MVLAERAGLPQLSTSPCIHRGYRGAPCKMFPALFPRTPASAAFSYVPPTSTSPRKSGANFREVFPFSMPSRFPPGGEGFLHVVPVKPLLVRSGHLTIRGKGNEGEKSCINIVRCWGSFHHRMGQGISGAANNGTTVRDAMQGASPSLHIRPQLQTNERTARGTLLVHLGRPEGVGEKSVYSHRTGKRRQPLLY